MNTSVENASYIALVDDDEHSARLLTRMLLAHGSPLVTWLGGADDGRECLQKVLADPNANWPSLVIVDLKSHSGANLEFLASLGTLIRQKGVPLAVMSQDMELETQAAIKAAGAGAVFLRQAEREAYRRETAAIVSFWARHQRLDAVGM